MIQLEKIYKNEEMSENRYGSGNEKCDEKKKVFRCL